MQKVREASGLFAAAFQLLSYFQGTDSKKKKKQCSFAEALADLDDIPGLSRKKPVVKIYEQRKDCDTGFYDVKERKSYPRKRGQVPKANKPQGTHLYYLI